jgi:hypothetical protein
MLLKFSEWSRNSEINESSNKTDKIINWLSSNFGGSVAKINSLLAKINKIETQYARDWNEIQTDIDALQIQRAQTKSDPAEAKKLERLIDRNRKLVGALNKKKASEISRVDKKVEEITEGNPRLVSYWNLKKTELEAELTEKLYKLAKQLTDQDIADELYDKYKEAALAAKEKDENFRKKFGRLDLAKPLEIPDPSTSTISRAKFSLDPILAMNAVQFTKYAQGLEKNQIKDLIKFMTTERNERYATLDTEKDRLVGQAMKKGLDKSSVDKDLKELREMMMGQIRDLRTKITIARRYA